MVIIVKFTKNLLNAGQTMRKNKSIKRGRPKGKPRTAAELAADAMRTGRPKKPEGAKRVILVSLRLTPDEFAQFIKDAERARLSKGAYAKQCWQQIEKGK